MRATNLLHIILLLGLVVPYGRWPEQGRVRPPWCEAASWRVLPAAELQAPPMAEVMRVGWHETLVPPSRTRQRHNPARNHQRWQRRYQRWLRTRPLVSRRQRRQRQQTVLRAVLGWTPPAQPAATKPSGTQPAPSAPPAELPAPTPAPEPVAPPAPQTVSQPVPCACPAQDRPGSTPTASPPDPLAELRQSRGWINGWSEEELWELLRRVRWAGGLRCPHCGETAPTCLEVIDRHYRGGLYRYRCLVCHLAGDEGEGGTLRLRSGQALH
jgi:hypothetical protein